ncbi:GerAB/ArcD/ProY family transporter [Paenibacillus pseudetheri]|uniref:Spore germination protein YndE n=1 Tax=Paenibacillus pseudetheri TaxID=2897682 RepID=A0ABN8FTV6_9BACL|nr:GerAB/ArcD/ProY family transporter [Paenibacillus pseudetheri]CAH1059088.1 Spore germination protein YndE [Paenibacillus pseudetheri]
MTQKEKMISRGQLFCFIIQAQIGVGILSLPFKLNETAKGGGALSVLIAGAITQLIIILLWVLLKNFPGHNLFSICLQIGGPIIGRILIIAYIGYFVLLGSNVMFSAVEVLQRWMLQTTPRWAILALFSIMTLYLAREKLTVLARFFTLAAVLFVPLILFVSYGLTQAHLEFMLPLLENGYWNIIKGVQDSAISMYGFEMMLIVYPLSEGTNKQRLMTISLASWFVTLLYVFVVFTCLTVFNSEQIKLIPEPVIYLVKSLNFYIVDRADILFLPIWSITLVCSIVSYCYAASIGLSVLLSRKSHKNFTPFVKISTYMIALAPVTPAGIHLFDIAATYASYVFIAGLSMVLLMISLFMKRKAGGLA